MSNENKETIADIVRMIRKSQNGNVHTISPKEAHALADRIEAAAKNQFRDATKTMPHEEVGNAAKMCETLIKVRSAICHFARYQCQSLSWEKSNIQANCCDVLCSWRDLCDAKTAINAALSALPRNCDIMDWRTAWAKWRTECHPQKPCGYAEVVSGTEQFMDWYMSEAKGETK